MSLSVMPEAGGVGCFADLDGTVRRFEFEPGQYPFSDEEHFLRGALECDRALLAGHLEPVPPHLVDSALERAPAHPWQIVHQSAEKWRAAQDYSLFTNRQASGKPFSLPTCLEAALMLGPASCMAKYDLRDGVWSVPKRDGCRHHLMVRHPAKGKLLWCKSLPFGYSLSPAVFCEVTESVAQEFRRRVAGRGIHIYVFVDDFLVSDRRHA